MARRGSCESYVDWPTGVSAREGGSQYFGIRVGEPRSQIRNIIQLNDTAGCGGPLPARRALPRDPGWRGLYFLARPPPSFGTNEAPALPYPPPSAEVAAPSKRGPSAFILALLTELSSAPPLEGLEGGAYSASFSLSY